MATNTSKESTDHRQSRVAELLDSGMTLDEIQTHARQHAEKRNREAQQTLPSPPTQPDEHFAARRGWCHDGQPIYGELKEFAWEAYRAGQSGDQATFSRQKDLLYKAVLTFIGAPKE